MDTVKIEISRHHYCSDRTDPRDLPPQLFKTAKVVEMECPGGTITESREPYVSRIRKASREQSGLDVRCPTCRSIIKIIPGLINNLNDTTNS